MCRVALITVAAAARSTRMWIFQIYNLPYRAPRPNNLNAIISVALFIKYIVVTVYLNVFNVDIYIHTRSHTHTYHILTIFIKQSCTRHFWNIIEYFASNGSSPPHFSLHFFFLNYFFIIMMFFFNIIMTSLCVCINYIFLSNETFT